MDLAEIVRLRPVPGAGVLLTLTQRCPLHCAHCSTASTMTGPAPVPAQLTRFVGSFRPDDRPEVVMMTGGEPLLRPDLVAGLAAAARRVGTRSAVLTGAFFATRTRIPAAVRRAIDAVDHLSVSIDAYHEREVSRAAVFRLLHTLRRAGMPVSLHAVGDGPDDPYLADLTAETRRVFGGEMPMLVNTVRPVGRAAAWAAARPAMPGPDEVLPCAMAAWPVVAADGTVLACCNQETVDRRPAPQHLTLGHLSTDDWAAVRERALSSPVLRLIRAAGPVRLLGRHGTATGGYCGTCRRLDEHPAALDAARRTAAGPVGALLDRHAATVQQTAGPVAFLRRHGSAAHARLVSPGPGGER